MLLTILDIESCPELIVPQENVEHLMVSSCACYENALEEVNNSASKDNTDEEACHELLRRLGNVRNELGVKYMFWSQEQYTKHMEEISENNAEQQESVQKLSDDLDDHKDDKTSKEDPLFLKLAMKSYDCLIRGIKAFGLVQDNVNMAFLYCNMGRFMRFRAHLVINNEK